MILSTTYKSRSCKVGHRKFIGIVDKITEHDLGNNFTKTDVEEIITIGRYNKYANQEPNYPILFPLACDKQAKRRAELEANKLRKETK